MHALTRRTLALAFVTSCNSEPHDEGTGHESTADAHESSAAPTTGTSTGETGHAHSTDTGTTHALTESDTGTTHAQTETGTTGDALTPAQAYCQCMVLDCHDEYHGTWGEDHDMSEAMCEAAAAALPSVGMPATQGDSVECRIHYCELAKTDPPACASAIGGGSCM